MTIDDVTFSASEIPVEMNKSVVLEKTFNEILNLKLCLERTENTTNDCHSLADLTDFAKYTKIGNKFSTNHIL